MSICHPMFPLKIVVFPGEQLNLHIFEPRYRTLIQECEDEGKTFGIPTVRDNRVQDFGTEIQLLEITNRYSDGRLDIKTKGLRRFAIESFRVKGAGKPYGEADIKFINEAFVGSSHLSEAIIQRIDELFGMMEIDKPFNRDPESFRTFEMGHHVGFSHQQEYNFLSLENEMDRQSFMLNHLEQLIPTIREVERLQERIQMNGHFRDYKSPSLDD